LINVILLKSGGNLLALGVDRLLRELDTLVSPLPEPANQSPFFSGGIILENGDTALVLDAAAIAERFRGGAWKEPERRTAARKSRLSILVVDDSFTARTLQKNILEAAGFEVRVATDGMEALGLLKVGEFDAVVADVQMPRMDGFELLKNIKSDERLRETPVVLVTSLSSEEDQARGLGLGAHAYIVKQRFDHQELLEVIRQMF
jgi:two-component system chemotaxis sensor kinase CheA